MDIRVELQDLTSVTSSLANSVTAGQDQLRGDLLTHFSLLPAFTTKMVENRMDDVLQKHTAQIESTTTALLADQNARLDPLIRRPPPRRLVRPQDSKLPQRRKHTTPKPEVVAINVRRYASVCTTTCICSCHTQSKAPAPAFINRVLGHLFVGTAGIPILSTKCDYNACKSSQAPRMSMEYWFPLGVFWSQILQLQVSYHASMGPQLSLRSLRRVPDSAQCVHYAMHGNIEGLKDLFRRGLASPWDVSSTRGYTLSRWALYSKQYKAARFLTLAGSDADYKPVAKTDNSTRHKAFDNFLQGGLNQEAEEDIQCLTSTSDWIEEQDFSKVHKIVVGLLLSSLEEAIAEDPKSLDVIDAMGRTPLLWAAARGDHKAVQVLLNHNADPNVMDMYLAPPVSYAADRGHTLCVKLLLEAGAMAEPRLSPGIKLGSPLNCAARNTKDPALLKYLLTYGAQVDNTGIDGNTALIHASRTDNIRFVILLLDYNAEINAANINQQTPLTTAIMYNSHGSLKLLLEHWEEFSTCPRLKGPNLLEIAALYADVETLGLLAETDHLKLKYDANFGLRDFAKRMTERVDVTDDLIKAFDNLLDVLNVNPERPRSRVSSLEKGLPLRRSALTTMYESEKVAADARESGKGHRYPESDESDEAREYEDAVEDSNLLDL
ncbi:MAG: hypothetical protein Q9204_006302 [Flavoplaca sp. TL-2023a]